MPFDNPPALPLRLADVAEQAMRLRFIADHHDPSPEQWAAIRDLLDHQEQAAAGKLEPAIYLSAISAGLGKTTAIAEATKALLSDPSRAGVGVLIAVSRITEVVDMATRLADHRDKLCLVATLTDEDRTRLSGHTTANGAQVCIATQAALKHTLRSVTSFDDAARFHFRGQRRLVVLWDEALVMSRPVVLDVDACGGLTKALRTLMKEQAGPAITALRRWADDVDAAADHTTSIVPDLAEDYGVDFLALEAVVADDDGDAATVKALRDLSGATALIRRDRFDGGMVLTSVPEIPSSLLPVIVADASAAKAVNHESYAAMAAQGRDIRRLKEAPKTYRNLNLKLVNAPASRSAYRDQDSDKGLNLINMAVNYIQAHPGEPVLVIGYKNTFAANIRGTKAKTIERAIRDCLTPADRDRVSYLNWGRHTATNDYTNHRHVILMGLNHLPRLASHAAAGAARGMKMQTAEDQPEKDAVEAMRRAMLRDSTLQAILRGNARKAVQGDCGPMTVVIPQVLSSGLSEAEYRGMFPDVDLTLERGLTPAKPLKGRVLELTQAILLRIDRGEATIPESSLRHDLQMDGSKKDFRAIIKRGDFQHWAEATGLIRIGPPTGEKSWTVEG
jgi:hypothetical protein